VLPVSNRVRTAARTLKFDLQGRAIVGNHVLGGIMKAEVSIGVDISKLRLDVFNLHSGELLEFENNALGIKKFVRYAKKAKPSFIICESTGSRIANLSGESTTSQGFCSSHGKIC
jgi:hypothetical protein